MTRQKPPAEEHRSAFKMTAQEAAEQRDCESPEAAEVRDRSVVSGQVVKTPDADLAYKVVLEHGDGRQSEHPFRTMRESEDFIKHRMPKAKPRDRSRDRAAGTA